MTDQETQTHGREQLSRIVAVMIEKSIPALIGNRPFVLAFTQKLVDFAHLWGKNYPDNIPAIQEEEEKLSIWISEQLA